MGWLYKWCASKLLKDWVEDVHVINFLVEHRNRAFQLPGLYDGAMSDECKKLCNDDLAVTEWLLSLHRQP